MCCWLFCNPGTLWHTTHYTPIWGFRQKYDKLLLGEGKLNIEKMLRIFRGWGGFWELVVCSGGVSTIHDIQILMLISWATIIQSWEKGGKQEEKNGKINHFMLNVRKNTLRKPSTSECSFLYTS